MGKKIILLIISIIIVSLVVYNLTKKEEAEFSLVEVIRGNVVQEVSETGQVKMGEEINLAFKTAGRIAQIYVKVGDEVGPGWALAKLDAAQLNIELQEAKYALSVAEAQLNQLLAGSSAEEIQAAQTDVDNAFVALEDAKAKLAEDVNQAYDDALNTLDNAYLKGLGALNTVRTIQTTYFYGNDQESVIVKKEKDDIENNLSQIRSDVDDAKAVGTQDKIDSALSGVKTLLSEIYNSLDVIRDMTEISTYQNIVSSANKSSLNTERINVNTALTNITDAQQDITSAKLTNQAKVNTAEGDLKEARDDLAIKKVAPRQTDIDYYQAQVNQSQAKVDLLAEQIADATLRSPTKGKITKINKKIGETVQPALGEGVIVVLPVNPYEIEVDIYEEDIVKMAVGNPVDISLVALPQNVFLGRVVSINPAEKLIERVVYYEVTIDFEEEVPQGIKPGMTADLIIKTDSRENILIIPEGGIIKKEGKNTVQVFQDGKTEEREIEIGLVGTGDDMVEVRSGLNEGEEIILR